MLKVLVLLFILLLFLDIVIAASNFDVIKYGSREFNDMPIYIENHRTVANRSQAEQKAIVHWLGQNETYTQIYFEALNWNYASFDDPWLNTHRGKREFTLQIFGNADSMFVNVIVFGFTERPLLNPENDIFSDVVPGVGASVIIKR